MHRKLFGPLILTIVSGCGQGEDLAGPPAPSLSIAVVTSGASTDPDGYALVIDGHAPIPIAVSDTILQSDVLPGRHTVDLQGLASGCSVAGGGLRTVAAVEGAPTLVDFSVTCSLAEAAATGAIRVSVSTVGVNLDADGYVVLVDPNDSRPVATSGEARFDSVLAGTRSVRLTSLAATCSVQGENPQSVDVPAGHEGTAAFLVRCWPAATGLIAFVHGIDFNTPLRVSVIGPDGAEHASFDVDARGPPSWSPDGRFLAMVEETISVGEISSGATTDLPNCAPTATRPSWSPNGQRLLCFDRSVSLPGGDEHPLSSMRRDGGDRHPIATGHLVTRAHYLADGSVLLLERNSPIVSAYLVASTGGTPRHLWDLPNDLALDDLVVPSPDGTRIAYVRSGVNQDELYVAGLTNESPRLLLADDQIDPFSQPLVWSPSGDRIAFATRDREGYDHPAFIPVDGLSPATVLPPRLTFLNAFDWSPDETWMTFSASDNVDLGDRADIYIIRVDGSGLQRLMATNGVDDTPTWAP